MTGEVIDRSGQTGGAEVENGVKINPGKSKTFSFTRAGLKDLLNYSLLDH